MAPPKKTSRAGDEIDAGLSESETHSLFATPEERMAWESKLNSIPKVDPRQQEIDNLLKSYESAKEKERTARIGTGIAARTMAISNPNAAKAILETRTPLDTMESDKIGEKLGLESKRLSNDSSMQKVGYEDQMLDKNSSVSNLFRSQLRAADIDVSDDATAKDMQTVFPWLKADLQADTSRRGQDMTYTTREKDRASREGVAERHESHSDSRARMIAQAGIDRTVIGGAIGQKTGASGGSGAGNARISTALTTGYPSTVFEDGNDNKFLIRAPGMPADPKVMDRVNSLNEEATKYTTALHRLRDAINEVQQSNGDVPPNFFNERWPEIKSLFTTALQTNVKFRQNGVVNGKDIEKAVEEIGDLDGLVNFIRRGLGQQVNTAIGSVKAQLQDIYKNSRLQMSDTPHPQDPGITGSGSGGGGKTGPVFDVTDMAVDAAKRQGLVPPKPNKPVEKKPEPVQGIPVVITLKNGQVINAIKMPDGSFRKAAK